MTDAKESADRIALLDKVREVLARRFPRCRDCADSGPICPSSDLPCDMTAAFAPIVAALRAPANIGDECAPADRMVQIDKLIADMQEIRRKFGNTCVYIRRGGLSWGSVALNRRDDDEKHGFFDLQASHDRDMEQRLEQIARLIAERDEWRAKAMAHTGGECTTPGDDNVL